MKLLILLSLTLTTSVAMANRPFFHQKYCQNDANTMISANGIVENYSKIKKNGGDFENYGFDTDVKFINENNIAKVTVDCAEGIKTKTTSSRMKFELRKLRGGIFNFSIPGLSADRTVIKGMMNCNYTEKTYFSCR